MSQRQLTPAASLRAAINFQATELRQAEPTETRAEIRARKMRIRSLELQLTSFATAEAV